MKGLFHFLLQLPGKVSSAQVRQFLEATAGWQFVIYFAEFWPVQNQWELYMFRSFRRPSFFTSISIPA